MAAGAAASHPAATCAGQQPLVQQSAPRPAVQPRAVPQPAPRGTHPAAGWQRTSCCRGRPAAAQSQGIRAAASCHCSCAAARVKHSRDSTSHPAQPCSSSSSSSDGGSHRGCCYHSSTWLGSPRPVQSCSGRPHRCLLRAQLHSRQWHSPPPRQPCSNWPCHCRHSVQLRSSLPQRCQRFAAQTAAFKHEPAAWLSNALEEEPAAVKAAQPAQYCATAGDGMSREQKYSASTVAAFL